MKKPSLGILCLLMLAVALDAEELRVTPTKIEYSGWNCDPRGGAADYQVTVFVQNPYAEAINVFYEYYDFVEDKMVDGGKACVVLPKGGAFCTITLPVRLGGEGNGTVPATILFRTEYEDAELETEVIIRINHMETVSEVHLLKSIKETEVEFEDKKILIESVCYKNVCCGMKDAKRSAETASANLIFARKKLRECSFTKVTSALSGVRERMNAMDVQYQTELKECSAALSQYEKAEGNISEVNMTLYARAACGILVNESRLRLNDAVEKMDEAKRFIEEGNYSLATNAISEAEERAEEALGLSEECQGELQPLPIINPTEAPSIPSPEEDGGITKFMSALGYIILAAIIIVVAVAIYISLGKGSFEIKAPKPPFPRGKKEEIPYDHERIDREFQEWLRSTERKGKGSR